MITFTVFHSFMRKLSLTKLARRALLLVFSACLLSTLSILSACSALLPTKVAPAAVYSLDDAQSKGQLMPVNKPIAVSRPGAPTLVVSTPRAAAGFDSRHMMYVRQAHQLEYFRQSEWVNTPAAMLSPLVVTALEKSASFGAVVQSPTSVAGQYRLDLDVLRLQQEFLTTPSRVHVTVRAHLLETSSHQVIDWREFDVSVAANSDDPYGGVVAANQAMRLVIAEMVTFCSNAVANVSRTSP